MSGEKSVERYVLFGERGAIGTLSNFLLTVDYLMRFGTAFGFSVEDAKQAEKVTIIGGTEFVSEEEEQAITDAGAVVARISGSEEDISQRLKARIEAKDPLP